MSNDTNHSKSVETLVEDIYRVVEEGVLPTPDLEYDLDQMGKAIARSIHTAMDRSEREPRRTLRMSNIGTKCNRKLWYICNEPEDEAPLRGSDRIKFMFGHMVEELILFLAKTAGHRVEGEQDTQDIRGVKGHRDAVIDGMVIDVKSASPYSFKKFQSGLTKEEDAFGYLGQIASYKHAGHEDPLVIDKERAGFLAIDKVAGKLALDIHTPDTSDLEEVYELKKEVVSQDTPPERGYEPEPYGKSGNMALPVNCGYCGFRHKCWPEARTFLYSNRPVHLVVVEKEPNVPELT